MEKINSFYKNKKILVTGATGFKGSWLCCWLLLMGAKSLWNWIQPKSK
jgi:CDP-glucose 4,6-dehydratase